jgi:hypothetical protein
MTVDNQDEPVQNMDSTPQADTSAPPEPVSEAAADQAAPPSEDTQPEGDGSSTNPDTAIKSPQEQQPTETVDQWKARYNELRSLKDRQVNSWQSKLKQQEQEIRQHRERVQQFERQQQEQAQRLQLKRWNKQHPEHTQFKGLLDKSRLIQSQIQRIKDDSQQSPESKQWAIQQIMADMKPEEVQELQAYHQNTQQFLQDFQADPHGAIAPIIQNEIQRAFQQQQQALEANQRVAQDFNDPDFSAAIATPEAKQEALDMLSGLQNGNLSAWDVTKENLSLKAQLRSLNSRVGPAEQAKIQANEQSRLAKSKATVNRDVSAEAHYNPIQAAKEAAAKDGITPDMSQFAQYILKFSNHFH